MPTDRADEDTVALHARSRGTGPDLIMLHGLFGSGDNLGGLARLLESSFTIHLLDLRNHGRSPHTASMSYAHMAADVVRYMDGAGIGKAHMFGHSMGGKTAMQLALGYRDRVQRLVVGDIAPVRYDHRHGQIIDGLQAVRHAAPETREAAESLLADFEEEPAIRSFLMTNWRRQTDGTYDWRMNLDAIEHDYPAIAAANTGGPFAGPTLFIKGSGSDYIQAIHRDPIRALFPEAQVRIMDGTGHWFHADKPDMTARIVARFFHADD